MRTPTVAFVIAAASAAPIWTAPAQAQQWFPSKPVRIISPFPPGGGNDTLCRIVAHKLTEELKQQVIVENRAGANGIVGTEVAARSAPDDYTIVLIPSGHAVNATLYRKLPFDSIRDFTPITLPGSSPLVPRGAGKGRARDQSFDAAAAGARGFAFLPGAAGGM